MKYKPEDFKHVAPEQVRKNLIVKILLEDHENLKANSKLLGVSMNNLINRCLKDAGLFHAKEEDTVSLLDLGR
jgi:hypothetical protein